MTPARARSGRRGRHAARLSLGRRVAPPATLLAAVGLSLGGLALTGPGGDAPPARLAALSAGDRLPVVLEDARGLIPERSTLTPTASDPSPRPVPTRASRSRRLLPWSSPVDGHLTSRFGWRWGRAHKGIDIGAAYGSPVRAVGAGVIVSAGWSGGYGNLVTVRHPDGTITAYAHMSAILVRSGRVFAGQQLGRVGSTGRSTGPHLHFEVRQGGGQANPLLWLKSRGIGI